MIRVTGLGGGGLRVERTTCLIVTVHDHSAIGVETHAPDVFPKRKAEEMGPHARRHCWLPVNGNLQRRLRPLIPERRNKCGSDVQDRDSGSDSILSALVNDLMRRSQFIEQPGLGLLMLRHHRFRLTRNEHFGEPLGPADIPVDQNCGGAWNPDRQVNCLGFLAERPFEFGIDAVSHLACSTLLPQHRTGLQEVIHYQLAKDDGVGITTRVIVVEVTEFGIVMLMATHPL